MSAKGKVAKMESGRKAVEILAWIVGQANAGKVVCLSEDWGGNSLTVWVGKQREDGLIDPGSHTHVGGAPGMELNGLIDNFHSTVTGRGGLSWA